MEVLIIKNDIENYSPLRRIANEDRIGLKQQMFVSHNLLSYIGLSQESDKDEVKQERVSCLAKF